MTTDAALADMLEAIWKDVTNKSPEVIYMNGELIEVFKRPTPYQVVSNVDWLKSLRNGGIK